MIRTLTLAGITLWSATVFGQLPVSVDISVNDYPTRWSVVGHGTYFGDQALLLDPGSYVFALTGVSDPYFEFTVLPTGWVQSGTPTRAEGGFQSLSLYTYPVDFEVAGYPARWTATGDGTSAEIFVGDTTLHLAAATYQFGLFNVDEELFQYGVGLSGEVTSYDLDVATGVGSILSLNTHPIEVDVQGYPTRWQGTGDTTSSSVFFGDSTLWLPPTTYTLGLFSLDPDYVQYSVDPIGSVTTSDPTRATGGLGSLTLQTHAIEVEVLGYPGRWLPTGDIVTGGVFRSDATVWLPPGPYPFGLLNVTDAFFEFEVSAAGTVSSSDPSLATSAGSTLSLTTTPVNFSVDGSPHPWSFGDTPHFTGDATLCLPLTSYPFSMGDGEFEYGVTASSVTPSSFTLPVSGTLYDIALGVGSAPCPPPLFVRGNCNASAGVDIADAIFLLDHLFSGGPNPACSDACDANDDGVLEISDVISLLDLLFGGSPEPTLPYPGCGQDPSFDALTCDDTSSCS